MQLPRMADNEMIRASNPKFPKFLRIWGLFPISTPNIKSRSQIKSVMTGWRWKLTRFERNKNPTPIPPNMKAITMNIDIFCYWENATAKIKLFLCVGMFLFENQTDYFKLVGNNIFFRQNNRIKRRIKQIWVFSLTVREFDFGWNKLA